MRAAGLGLILSAAGCGDAKSELIYRAPTLERDSGTGPSCESDADCTGAAPRCDVNGGRCVACLSNADCEQITCTSEECAERRLCDPERLECVECVRDSHCVDPGEVCSALLGECAFDCAGGTPCPSDEPFCDSVLGVCAECITDADCGGGALCRRAECLDPT